MSWYRDGVVNLTNGSKQVTGVGTQWVDSAVMPGGLFFAPGGPYEVDTVNSDTQLQLVTPYTGATTSGLAYSVAPTQGLSVNLARQLSLVLSSLGTLKDAWLSGLIATTSSLAAKAGLAVLAATGGASLIGYDGGTLQDIADNAKTLQSYTALRAYTGRASGANITSGGVAGRFQRDAGDTTSADNGGTIIVDGSGRRWKRLFAGDVNVMWFGATGNGTTDDTTAIQRAINFIKSVTGGTLYFPNGTYSVGSVYTLPSGGSYLDQYMIDVSNTVNLTLRGESKSAVIRLKNHFLDGGVDAQSNAHIFSGSAASGFTLDGLFFDLNGATNLTPAGKIRNSIAVRIQNGDRLTVRGCKFVNSGGHNVISAGGAGDTFILKDNEFVNGGRGVPGNVNNPDFSFVYSEWKNTKASHNTITQEFGPGGFSGGIELHGSDSYATHNTITNCEPAIWIASVPYAISNIVVSDNIFKDCNRGVAFWRGLTLKNITISDNEISVKKWAGSASAGISIPMPADGIFTADVAHGGYIENLTINDNTITDGQPDLPDASNYGILLASLKTAKIHNNTISRMNGPGIVLSGSPFGMTDVSVTENQISNCGRNTSGFGHDALFINLNGTSTTPSASQFFASGMSFRSNTLRNDTVRAGSKAYSLAWPNGSMSSLEIKDNEPINFEVIWAGNQGYDYNFAQGLRALIRTEFSAVGAPDAGTWKRGDIAWSVFQAAAGTPVGWLCVAAGTPGTWAPFGLTGAVRASSQPNSSATTFPAMVADFNDLVARLRTAGLMA
jgi:hypothetical protein